MKIYNSVTIDIATGKIVDEHSFDYVGEVAELKGPKTQQPVPYYSEASKIVKGMRAPLSGAIRQDIITNPFTDYGSQQYKQAVGDIRGGYGARGLEGSGIAIKGEQDALQKIASQVQAQRAGQLIGVLGTASGSPAVGTPTQSQGSGFMGLK
jgi:hypothetical protein